jgi:hypothetical protein
MGNEVGSLLKWSLRIYGTIGVIYGLIFLLFPAGFVAFSGSEPVAFSWVRWPGGALVGFGLGCALLSRNPSKQGLFVTTAGIFSSLVGLALLYNIVAGEYTSRFSSVLVPAVINLGAAILIWIGRAQNKDKL